MLAFGVGEDRQNAPDAKIVFGSSKITQRKTHDGCPSGLVWSH